MFQLQLFSDTNTNWDTSSAEPALVVNPFWSINFKRVSSGTNNSLDLKIPLFKVASLNVHLYLLVTWFTSPEINLDKVYSAPLKVDCSEGFTQASKHNNAEEPLLFMFIILSLCDVVRTAEVWLMKLSVS